MGGQNTAVSLPQGAESRPEGWPPPLPAGEELSCSPGQTQCHCSPVIVPGFLVSKEWVGARARLQWLEMEACEVQSPSRPGSSLPGEAPQVQATVITNCGFGQPMDISRVSMKGILRAALPTSDRGHEAQISWWMGKVL